MKAPNRIIIPALALTLAAGACTQVDENFPMGNDKGNELEFTINCPSGEGDPTRTDIQGLNPVWRAGDKIWLSDGKDVASATVPQEYDGLGHASIKVSGLSPDSTIYALYPFQDGATVSRGVIYARVPVVQSGRFADAHLAVGTSVPASDRTIDFKNASAILKFTTFREDLWHMQLHNTSVDFSGDFKLNPETGAKSGGVNGQRKVNLNYKDGGNTGEKYLSVMEGNLPKGAKLTFITKDGRMGYIYTSVRNALSNGYIYDLGDIDDLITMDSEPAIDLSAEESANSYLITSGGSYRFKAVEGNSTNELEDVAYGDVVWETVNTLSAPMKFSLASEVAYCDGYMYVRIPDDAPDGNMLISACDEYGNILWSWHLWLLREGVADQVWPSGATMMDRNLGALSATPGDVLANGFLYEWGRKDPFPGIGKLKSSSAMVVSGTAFKAVASSNETGTVAYATAHPYAYIWKDGDNWEAVEDLTLWSAALKTKYDPCPPGYHVPYESVFSGMTASNVLLDEANYGRKITYDSKTIWFPFAGRRQSGSSGQLNVGYSSAPMSFHYYDVKTSSSGKYAWIGSTDSFAAGNENYQKVHASGFSMRCQKFVPSGDVMNVVLKYKIEDTSYGVMAPSFTGEEYGMRMIDWGDGSSESLKLSSGLYHYYKAAGIYTLTVTTVDVSSITVPLGDLIEIDVTGF